MLTVTLRVRVVAVYLTTSVRRSSLPPLTVYARSVMARVGTLRVGLEIGEE